MRVLNFGNYMSKRQQKIKLILFFAITGLLFLSIFPVIAAVEDPLTFRPQVGLPGFESNIVMEKDDTSYIAKMVQAFYNYGLSIGGILAAIVLMVGGVIWLTSAGSSDKVSQAKGLIMGSISGLILLFGAWIVLNTINPDLLNFKIRNIKGIVPTFIMDGNDGIIDDERSLPEDARIKFLCLGAYQTCSDTLPPSINLDISICKERLPDITCSGNTPQKWCCAQSDEVDDETNKQCLSKPEGTTCKPTPTSPENSGYCHDNKCDGEKICCLCGQGCVAGLCVYASCRNDVTVSECQEWCTNGWVGYSHYYYPGGSKNYTCAGGAYSYCNEK